MSATTVRSWTSKNGTNRVKPTSTTNSVKTTSTRSAGSKYGTVSGIPSSSKKRPTMLKLGFFDDPKDDKPAEKREPEVRVDRAGRPNAQVAEDAPWDVSVAERKLATKRNKRPADPGYTLYVTTPTASLTLARSVSQVAQLDANLRASLPTSSLPASSPVTRLTSGRATKRNVLATLSRTFSPTKQRPALLTTDDEKANEEDDRNPLASLSTYLTDLAKDPTIRASADWRRFFAASGSEDLESLRIERRPRKVHSDPAHPASPTTTAAPAYVEPSEVVEPVEAEEKVMDVDERSSVGKAEELLDAVDAEAELDRLAQSPSTELTSATSSTSDVFELPQRPATADPTKQEAKIANRLSVASTKKSEARVASKLTIDDFEIIRVLGKGCAGKVLLVRQKATRQTYALKTIFKQHVLAHRELEHTLTEQRVLKKVASDRSARHHTANPFVIQLHSSFHDADNLYLCLSFHPGGDLATQLSRWGRLNKDRARFYSAEIAAGLEELHRVGIIYRDLKPENILIAADGHIVLTDFGLSKYFTRRGPIEEETATFTHAPVEAGIEGEGAEREAKKEKRKGKSSLPAWAGRSDEATTTTTFCGTAEYLAPEVLMGEKYSYEVDWWSYGTMLYEMLHGMTPFWAENHSDMYRRVLYDDLRFPHFDRPEDMLDQPTRSFLRGLLQKDPTLRMSDGRVRQHTYFAALSWPYIYAKRYIPPFVPVLNGDDDTDTRNFDEQFLGMDATLDWESKKSEASATAEEEEEGEGDEGKQSVKSPKKEPQARYDGEGREVFAEYDFRSPLMTPEVEEEEVLETETEATEEEVAPETLVSVEEASVAAASTQDEEDEGAITSSSVVDSPVSTRATSVEASSPPHGRQVSTALQSLTECDKEEAGEIEVKEASEPEEEWDVVEASTDIGPGSRNGNGGRDGPRSLFARGVVDKYRLQIRGRSRPSDGRSIALSRNNSHLSSSRSSINSLSPSNSAPESPNLPRAPRRPALMERSSSSMGLAFQPSPGRRFRIKRTRSAAPDSSGRATPAPSPRLLAVETLDRSTTPDSRQSELTLSASHLDEVAEADEEADEAEDGLALKVKRKLTKRLTLQGPLGMLFGSPTKAPTHDITT